ncbi:hypothetical protein B1R94_16990 [Mycolicibacterium litorale]|nr:hypothetical protein B1R94_16990 [Mycolicibacterium litorale]
MADPIGQREVAAEAERQRQWDATRAALDSLGPEIVAECRRHRRKRIRLDGALFRRAWAFRLCTEHIPGHGITCMHLAFHTDGSWTLLGAHNAHHNGSHNGHCARPVAKTAPLHPGLRQGFVFDAHRHEADVVFKYSRRHIREALLGQIRRA